MKWNEMTNVPMDGRKVILFTKCHGVCEAWFAKGGWSEETPISPSEYDGDVWVCCDDAFTIEVEFDQDEVFHGTATHWVEYSEPNP